MTENQNLQLDTPQEPVSPTPEKKKMGKAELICTIIFLVITVAAVGFFGYYYVITVIDMIAGGDLAALGFAFAFAYNLYFNSIVVVALTIFCIVMKSVFKRAKIPFIALMVDVGLYVLFVLTYLIVTIT